MLLGLASGDRLANLENHKNYILTEIVTDESNYMISDSQLH